MSSRQSFFVHVQRTLLLLLCVLSQVLLAAEEGISVIGNAETEVVPDQATFTFAIQARGSNPDGLRAEVDRKTAAVLALADSLKIARENITTARIAINPQYNYQTNTFLGYDVERTIVILLSDLDHYTTLVNGAIEAGITQIRHVELNVADRTLLEEKTMAAAVTDAQRKATVLAESAGVRLGKVMRIDDSGSGVIRPEMAMRTLSVAMDHEPVFEPGQIRITSSVMVTFSIR